MSAHVPPGSDYASELLFYVNGERIQLRDVDPSILLVDWLRSPDTGLTGTKKACGQGGCGACTVMLSRWIVEEERAQHLAINSCLRPLASLDGMAITTVEGVGTVESEMGPVQWQMAIDNGSQCGFCTPGWVMTMHSHLAESGDDPGGQLEVEEIFDGNLCRCTGYRPILYAMKHFASDFEECAGCMTCRAAPGTAPQHSHEVTSHFPDELKRPPRQVHYQGNGYQWIRPTSLEALLALIAELPQGLDGAKLVVGNTSVGVYDRFVEDPRLLVDIGQVAELRGVTESSEEIRVGAARSYSDFLGDLDRLLQSLPDESSDGVRALRYMVHRTAGTIVRNAASLAGNTMLVARHVRDGTGDPFPSDAFTALVALGATVVVASPEWPEPREMPLLEFATTWADDDTLSRRSVLVEYRIPVRGGRVVRSYKTALREVNSHTIVNATLSLEVGGGGTVGDSTLVFGGLGPVAFRATATEALLNGADWTADTLAGALEALRSEVVQHLDAYEPRRQRIANEGFTPEYLVSLAESYLYKFFLTVAEVVAPGLVPPDLKSAAVVWKRPLSAGTQKYEHEHDDDPAGEPLISPYAFLQATGEARYTHDLEPPRRSVWAVMAVSEKARARVHYQIPEGDGWRRCTLDELDAHLSERFDGFTAYVTYRDVPEGGTAILGVDDDSFVLVMKDGEPGPEGEVFWHGQPLGIVCAEDERTAELAAHYVQSRCTAYDSEGLDVLLTIEEAEAADSWLLDMPPYPVHVESVTRKGSTFQWLDSGDEAVIDGVPCKVVSGTQRTGSQIHFYMETQSCLAVPGESGEMTLHASTQSPDSVQGTVSRALDLAHNMVHVKTRRLGGAYGGKTTRSVFAAAAAALAARTLHRPVLFMMPRASDTAMFGHRHPVRGRYRVAIADSDDPHDHGRIMGWHTDFVLDGGWTHDCTFVVSDCIQLRADNAYMVPNYETVSKASKTNKTSNTAFRSFGLIQGMIIQEDAVEAAAAALGILAEDVRERNLYRLGDATPFGEYMDYCYMREVWRYARKESEFDARVEEVKRFNDANRWKKRGISLVPVKYGSGYNLASMEQAGAYVEVYKSDGSVLLRHGGVEMGQGVTVKVTQVAAHALNLPMHMIRMAESDTSIIPNPTSTGASTGTAYNGAAIGQACTALRKRLEAFCLDMLRQHGKDWCEEKGINFWDHDDGWRAEKGKIWQNVVSLAYTNRINLSAQVRFKQAGGERPDTGLGFTPGAEEEADNFTGFTYSAACTEVEVDLLTGEAFVLRSDIFYDAGKSLNPAIDVGQVEGAFVQGLGYVLTEELVYQEDGPDRGRLNTLNTWRYKPPAYTTIPIDFRVELFPRHEVEGVPENPYDLLSSKEVGEPPMVLASTAFFAIKRAIQASREERGIEGWFEMACPATVQEVRNAARVSADELTLSP